MYSTTGRNGAPAPARAEPVFAARGSSDGDRAWQVSIGGGTTPQWSADGRELFCRRGNALLAASIRTSADGVTTERPRELFRGTFVNQNDTWDWSYDPSTDSFARRFLDHRSAGMALE